MKNNKISSLNDLYSRVLPALDTRKNDFVKQGFNYIMSEDIWNYLKLHKWNKDKNIKLYQMVDDILNVNAKEIDFYLKDHLNTIKRKILPDDDIL